MKQFYALTSVVFFSLQVTAQFTQNFDDANALTSGCNLTVNSDRTITAGEVISGTASLYSNPPVNGSGTRDYSTPYLKIVDPVDPFATSTSFTVSFNYKLNETLNGQAVRTIEIGLQGLSGYISLTTITMDKNYDPLTAVTFNQSFTVPTGVYRLVLKMGGSQGNGSVRIIIDDLVASANPYYTLNGTCNLAPVVANDVYFTTNSTSATTFTSVLANDSDPNGESFSAPAVTATSPDGTVVFNNDGSFTFTPNPGFTGSSTSFTYTVYDNGFDPLAGTALVTIYFSSGAPLPVRLINFNGSLINNKTALSWSVANNEDNAKIEIEKSTDGKNFVTGSIVMSALKSGAQNYEYRESKELETTTYYRLKIVNRNSTFSYSGIVKLSFGKAIENASLMMMQNPVRNSLNFNYSSSTNTTGTAIIYDMSGKKLLNQQLNLRKGVNVVSMDLANKIVAGTYILEIVSSSERATTKFIRQ
jgi:Bacterial Ig domain